MTNTTPMLLALSLLLGGCVVDADLETTAQQSIAHPILLPASGTGQNREVMSTFDPLVVTLTDTYGAPIEGAVITFTSPVAGATSTFRFAGQAETDADGRAELRPYANALAGTYTVWAHADGAEPMPFVLTNTAAAPAIILPILGTSQFQPLGMPFPYPLTVEVHDNYGNLVEGAPVSFVAPMTGATTHMTEGGASVTDDEGRASVFATAGEIAGTYTVLAKVTGAPSIPFVLSNMNEGDMVLPTAPTTQFHVMTTGTYAP